MVTFIPAIGEDDISPLIQQLASLDVGERMGAAAKVAQLGPDAVAAVPALIEAIKCEGLEILFASPQIDASRRQFADVLVKIGAPAKPQLVKALDHTNDLVRVWAAYALLRIDSEQHRDQALAALVNSFGEGVEVACDAAMVLESMGVEATAATNVLVQQLGHRDITVRCNAAHALTKIAVSEPAKIRKALDHDSKLTRVGAAYVLFRVDSTSGALVRKVLSRALRDSSADVRRQAVWAIGQMGVEGAPLAADLIAVLETLDPDPMSYFRGGRLGRLGMDPSLVLAATGEESKPALVKALKSDSAHTRVLAAVALQRLDPKSGSLTGPILAKAGSDGDQVLQMIASMNYAPQASFQEADIDELIRLAMGARGFGPPSPATRLLARRGLEAVEPLIEVLTGDDGLAAGKAAGILAQIGAPAIPSLAKVMKSDQDRHRFFAVRALAQMGPSTLPHLAEALSDESYPVRRVARYALQSIGTPEATSALQGEEGVEK